MHRQLEAEVRRRIAVYESVTGVEVYIIRFVKFSCSLCCSPNVCTTREEVEEEAEGRGRRRHHFRSTVNCDTTQTMYKCVRV